MSSYRTGGYGEKDIYEVITIEPVWVDGLLTDENKKVIEGEKYTVSLLPLESASKNAASQTVNVDSNGNFKTTCLSDNAFKVVVLYLGDTLATDTLTLDLQEEKNQRVAYSCIIPSVKKDMDDTAVVVSSDTVITPAAQKTQQIIYFPLNISDIGPASKNELREIIAFVQKDSNAKITISGHADGSGSEKINTQLSEKRANSVKEYLIAKGVDASRIKIQAFGSHQPQASNETEAGRAKNRRAEITVK